MYGDVWHIGIKCADEWPLFRDVIQNTFFSWAMNFIQTNAKL